MSDDAQDPKDSELINTAREIFFLKKIMIFVSMTLFCLITFTVLGIYIYVTIWGKPSPNNESILALINAVSLMLDKLFGA